MPNRLLFEVSEYPNAYSSFLISVAEDKELRAAVKAAVLALAEQGNQLGSPISEPLEHGIFELRPHSSTRQARLLYYFRDGEKKAVIVHCFIKKTRATPRADIDLAKERRKTLENERKRQRKHGGSNGHRKTH